MIWDGILNFALGMNQMSANQGISNKQLDLAEKEYYSNVDIMNKNFGLQQETFNYNKAQAELTRQREDNAFQRRVQDYINSGFSPLAAQGVASSSQAPTLTAPQLDPSGVNQATANRLSAYQNAISNNNQTAQLKLQSQQLKLAEIETAKGILESAFNLKRTGQEITKLSYENKHYDKYGFKDTTLQSLLSSILKNINVDGKTPGEAIADAVNDIINDENNDYSNNGHNNFQKLIDHLEVEKNVSQNNAINNPKKGDFTLLTNNKKFDNILEDIHKLTSWPTATGYRKQRIQKYLDSLGISYNKDLFSKFELSNEEVKYLQDLLINYRRQIIGH